MHIWISSKYKEFIEKNGYVPSIFNPWNMKHITDFSPTLTTGCGSPSNRNGLIIIDELINKERVDIITENNKVNTDTTMKDEVSVMSLFSGIGAFEKGLKDAGINYKLNGFSEIDKYAITAYCAIHDTNEELNMGDISMKRDLSEYKGTDLVVGGSPCFRAGTLITTKDGQKRIEDIKAGEMVLTHKNRFREVLQTMINPSDMIYDIKIKGSPTTHVTEEHPYYVRESTQPYNNKSKKRTRIFSEPKWKTVKDLKKGDYIGLPINKESLNPLKLSKEECYLIGRYMSGSVSQQEISTLIEKHSIIAEIKDRGIPGELLNLPVELIQQILEGYLLNATIVNNYTYSTASTSKEFVFSLAQLILKAYRAPYSIFNIERKNMNKEDVWCIVFQTRETRVSRSLIIDDYLWQPFKSKKLLDMKDCVYNFEVIEDNSYVANNCIVHNCQDFSLAGNRQGSKYLCLDCNHEYNPLFHHYTNRDSCPNCNSRNLEKTRSSLLIEYLRAIRETNPKYFIYENVSGLLTKPFIAGFNRFVEELEEYGYNVYHDILNSKDYGIPQNRKRVFVVGIRKDVDTKDFKFPEPFDNGLRLKHLLEEEVDEKYYINNEKTEKLIEEIRNKNQGISYCIDANYHKGTTPEDFLAKSRRQLVCIPCLTPDRLERRQNGRRFKTDGEPMFTLTTQDRHGVILSGKKNEDTNKILQLNNPNHFSRRVYSKEGISPTIAAGNNGGGKEPCKIIEELKIKFECNCGETSTIDDLSTPCPHCGKIDKGYATYLNQKDNVALEPSILRYERTEYGKEIRKQYEDGEVNEKIGNMRELKPREDGISNTLTTVPKDNMLLEPNELQFVGGLGDKDWVGDNKELSRNYPQGNRVYSVEGLACSQTAQGGGIGGVTGLYMEKGTPNEIQMVEVNQLVKVRKYEVDTEKLIKCLREHKESSKLTNKQISEQLNKPITLVEHWFRKNSSFAIPDSDIWYKLKELLNIETDEFDSSITEFIEKEGIYEKGNRYYHENGVAPTLTTSANERIIEETSNELKLFTNLSGGKWDKMHDTNKRVYDSEGIAPTITTMKGGHREPKAHHRYRIRKLTPKECWRLMGFKDDDYEKAKDALINKYYKGKDKTNSQMYKMAGNSIVVRVLELIFRNLFSSQD